MQSSLRILRRAAPLLFSGLLAAMLCTGAARPAAAQTAGGFSGLSGLGGAGGLSGISGMGRSDGMGARGGLGVGVGLGETGAYGASSTTPWIPGAGRPSCSERGCPGRHWLNGRLILHGGAAQIYAARGGGNGNAGVPRGEWRFVPDEVITEFVSGASTQAIDRLARRYGLHKLESQDFSLIGSAIYRWHVGAGRSVVNVVGALSGERIVASVQPNYVFTLQDQPATEAKQGDSAQYVLGKLQIEEAHRLATGKNILVAVIDSQIDAKHPDLNGAVVRGYDALDSVEIPDAHGTAMAGAIAAHGKLLGVAPDVEILAARAFDETPRGAKGTSFAICKGLQWAADNGARIVNMSFVGPADPLMERMLAAAYAKDMVLVAAAGNAGPTSPPLYPAADPDVIAVTATDSHDALFAMANRGAYIAVAAPGVEILAVAPGQSYDITTGTSVAAAHVSGVVALLLERNGALKPKEIRALIMATAKRLGPAAHSSDYGAGLVNAYRAVMQANASPAGKNAQATQ